MPYCPQCSTKVEVTSAFCLTCGVIIAGGGGRPLGPKLPFRISLTRVVSMTLLSYGLYLFYWFYLTWRQYRDHSRVKVFPAWHAISILVPIYGWFRVKIHMRQFKELMIKAGLPTSINERLAMTLVAISSSLDWHSFRLSLGEANQGGMVLEMVLFTLMLDLLKLGMVAWLLFYVQGNLNRYWSCLPNVRLINAKVGFGEVVSVGVGILAWYGTFNALFNPGASLVF